MQAESFAAELSWGTKLEMLPMGLTTRSRCCEEAAVCGPVGKKPGGTRGYRKGAHMWESDDNLPKSVQCFERVGSGD